MQLEPRQKIRCIRNTMVYRCRCNEACDRQTDRQMDVRMLLTVFVQVFRYNVSFESPSGGVVAQSWISDLRHRRAHAVAECV